MKRAKKSPFTKPRGLLSPEAIAAMEDIFGEVNTAAPTYKVTYRAGKNSPDEKAWAPGIMPAPGEQPHVEPEGPTRNGRNSVNRFLYPQLPASFLAWEIRKMSLDELRARYLKVLNASMGNHSMSMFYCCWEQEQFEAALDAKFKKQILLAKARLLDRATYILHKACGLVKSDPWAEDPTANAVTVSRVVDKLYETRSETSSSGEGFKLTVEGLDRTKKLPPAPMPLVPPPPPSPPAPKARPA